MPAPTVSIIIPNYNHARYLKQRLDSIVHQTVRDWELILLDDASTDDSLAVMERYAHRPNVRIVRNEQNSGSPFKQWMKGLALAQAEVVWFAESDDSCDPGFLQALLPAFRRPDVRLAYANSMVIDENGKPQGDYSGVEYLTSLSKTKWKKNYVTSAADEVDQALGVKNTILSASGVLFRKFELSESLRRGLEEMRLAGDWLFIAHAILGGSVWYDARPLNHHRRHKESVIASAVADKKLTDFFREFRRVQEFIFESYPVSEAFEQRWEQYLRKQWNDFCPGRPFSEINQYYPLEEMRARLRKTPGAPAAAPAPRAAVEEMVAAPRARPAPPPPDASSPVLVISHDAYRAGAQIVLLTLLREWKKAQPFPVRLLIVEASDPRTFGALRKDFESQCQTLVLSDFKDPEKRTEALEAFLRPTPRLIYSNTVVNGLMLGQLDWLGRPVITHVHELAHAIDRWAPGKIMAETLRCTQHFIAVSDEVAQNLRVRHRVPDERITTIKPVIELRKPDPAAARQMRQRLGIQDGELAVFGCGTIDWRKGADLFVGIGVQVARKAKNMRFFWVGGPPELSDGAQKKVNAQGLEKRITFLGPRSDARECFAAGDIFLLSSREDPFPLVALEAADAGKPIVCFEESGGMPDFVRNECGLVVPKEDMHAAAVALAELAGNAKARHRLGAQGKAKVARDHSSTAAAARIADLVKQQALGSTAAGATARAEPVLKNEGYCPTCDSQTIFVANNPWLRDHYICTKCKSIPRERSLMVVIEQFMPGWRDAVIHESSPGGRGASVRLQRECKGKYLPTWFFPDRPLGSTGRDGRRCENLEALTFDDGSIDLHVSQDVMEHVFDPVKAFREIARTLKPGGAHIFTVPLVHKGKPSRRRAELVDGRIRHLVEPPQYHGNPISAEGSLVTFDWGYDICRHIHEACGLFTHVVHLDDLSRGIRAEYIEVLVTTKPA